MQNRTSLGFRTARFYVSGPKRQLLRQHARDANESCGHHGWRELRQWDGSSIIEFARQDALIEFDTIRYLFYGECHWLDL